MIRPIAFGLFVGISLSLAGCSSPKGVALSGQVSYGDGPMALGLITFEPQSGSGTTGAGATVAVKDGQFTVPPEKLLTPGKYVVRISPPEIGSGVDLKNLPPQFPLWESQVDIQAGMAPLEFKVPEMKKK